MTTALSEATSSENPIVAERKDIQKVEQALIRMEQAGEAPFGSFPSIIIKDSGVPTNYEPGNNTSFVDTAQSAIQKELNRGIQEVSSFEDFHRNSRIKMAKMRQEDGIFVYMHKLQNKDRSGFLAFCTNADGSVMFQLQEDTDAKIIGKYVYTTIVTLAKVDGEYVQKVKYVANTRGEEHTFTKSTQYRF